MEAQLKMSFCHDFTFDVWNEVLCQSLNNPEILQLHFRRQRYAPNHCRNICTKFYDDWSISKEMANVFQNRRLQRPPSWIFTTIYFRRHRYVSKLNIFPLILVTISQSVKKWQPFFEIQDGAWPPSWIMATQIFRRHRCVLNQSI